MSSTTSKADVMTDATQQRTVKPLLMDRDRDSKEPSTPSWRTNSPSAASDISSMTTSTTGYSSSSDDDASRRHRYRSKFQPDVVKTLHSLIVTYVCLPFIDSFFKSVFRNASESLRLVLSNDVTRDYGNSKQGTDADGNNNPGSIVTLDIVAPVHFCWKMLLDPKLGLGESYMDGDWRAKPNPAEFLMLLMRAKKESREKSSMSSIRSTNLRKTLTKYGLNLIRKMAAFINFVQHWLKENTIGQAAKNISEHYDLGNDLFKLFLDYSMFYSCGVFTDTNKKVDAVDFKELYEAQIRKVDLLLEQLELNKDDHLLEIGCGWGTAAIRGVKNTGCKWTGITISREQLDYAREKVAESNLQGLIDLQYEDYRQTSGTFSKVLSIEMIEAVGHKYVPTYFRAINERLTPGGKAAIQAILCPDAVYEKYVNSNDFIRKHIFPGGHLPSLQYIKECLPKELSIAKVEYLQPHYAMTLTHWNHAWMRHRDDILDMGYSPAFHRKWEFYFSLCRAVFAYDHIHVAQILIQKE
ncbi:hypothetical protein WR25_24201 [Diploscapter pachys]|uniref:Cyclopropane-fatty-acyl-phospholipid synthase n=1 Tax=Diploscapter pachys TaxID=2018661 RepID=A0A2A2LXC6_9BILA|nr:hypothetical protein WR25_24201 [Diploscapter pachys]